MKEVSDWESFKILLETHHVVFLDVYATWCGPCKKIAPVFEELSRKFQSSLFTKTNCADSQDIAFKLNVASIPTFIVFVDGKEVDRISGGNSEKLRSFVEEYAE